MIPMKFSSHLIFAAMAFAVCGLTSCGSSGSVDMKYPTVQQMDDVDVQWGLSKRKPRGTPSRNLAYDPAVGVPAGGGGEGAGAIQAPAMRDPVLDGSPQTSNAPNPAPVIPDQLR